jgi:xanthine dehydrogenase YagS FAD-binding subunit
MATNGGNLLQRTRCIYFYDTATHCNKRERGTGCSAIDGFNRMHAVLGASDQCIAVHPSDMCVALAALEAVVRVTGKNGGRSIPMGGFHRLPGETPDTDTNLHSNEIILSIDLPRKGFADHHAYLKVRDRASYAFALVSVAVALEMSGDIIEEARVALGGVAHKPWRNTEAEALLIGKAATRNNFQIVAETILRNAKGLEHNTFKIELSKRAIVRALTHAAQTESRR